MAPRKSTSSNAADANGDASMVSNATAASSTSHAHPKPSRQSGSGARQDADGVSIDDLLLPRTLIQRLARGVLPPNTSLQRDAVLALSKSATVFISYLAHHANEQSTRKTLSSQDVLKALKEIELANVMDLGAVGKDGRTGGRLERELEVYEHALMQKRKGARDRKSNKARESTGTGIDGGDEADEKERGEPSNKRARRMEEDDDEDADEENRMLDLQLNGAQPEEELPPPNTTKGTRRKKHATAPLPTTDEKGKGKVVDTESDPELDPEEEEEEEEEDEDDDDDDENENENDDDDDDDDEDDDENDEEAEDQLEERNGSRSRNGHRGLQPNGRVEIEGSDEDSD